VRRYAVARQHQVAGCVEDLKDGRLDLVGVLTEVDVPVTGVGEVEERLNGNLDLEQRVDGEIDREPDGEHHDDRRAQDASQD